MTTAQDFYKLVSGRLTEVLGASEGAAAARIIFEDVAGYDRKWLFMNGTREITDYMQGKIDAAVRKVEAGEPVQYAVGSALFMGMRLAVTEDVLIPRFETEGLVDAVVDLAAGRSDLRVLDIGTGSGCIAIALARALPFSRVTAVDISPAALKVAQANANALKVKVDFEERDALTMKAASGETYDFIVSNPPYVMESEKAEMDRRVFGFEPAGALFVPDSDPLRFYRAISAFAAETLAPEGWLCFEINSLFPTQTAELMEKAGLTNVEVRRDYRGNPRFAFGQKK